MRPERDGACRRNRKRGTAPAHSNTHRRVSVCPLEGAEADVCLTPPPHTHTSLPSFSNSDTCIRNRGGGALLYGVLTPPPPHPQPFAPPFRHRRLRRAQTLMRSEPRLGRRPCSIASVRSRSECEQILPRAGRVRVCGYMRKRRIVARSPPLSLSLRSCHVSSPPPILP